MNKNLNEVKLKPVKTWFTNILTNQADGSSGARIGAHYLPLKQLKVEIKKVKTDIALADEVGVGNESVDMICESLNDDYTGPTLDVKDLISKAEKNIREGNLLEAEKLFKEADELGAGREYPPSDPEFTWTETRKYSVYEGVYRAATALGHLGDKRAVPPLIDKLDQELPDATYDGGSTSFCTIIVEALGNIGDERAQDVLEKALEFSSTLGYGIDLFGVGKALTKMKSGDKQSSERNAEMLLKNYNYQRSDTWGQLEMIGEPAVKPLIKAIKDEEGVLDLSDRHKIDKVKYAAETLGKIGDKRAVKPLVKLLQNSFPSEDSPMLYAARALNNIAEENQHDDVDGMVDTGENKDEYSGFYTKKCEHIYEEDDGTYLYGQCECIMSDPTNHLGQKILALLEKYNENEMNLKATYILARGVALYGNSKDVYRKARFEELISMGGVAIEPLITYYIANEGGYRSPTGDDCSSVIEILVKITEEYIKTEEKKKILKFLKNEDSAMIMMGVSLLKTKINK